MNRTAAETMVKASDTTETLKPETPKPTEFADDRYVQMGKERLQLFADGEYEKWGEGLADNAVAYWSAGDSLSGKKAIVNYWKTQAEKYTGPAQLTKDIWLPLKVNVPQQSPDLPGIWLLCWNQVAVKYKNGKALQYWMHQSMHYNTQDKIDRMIVYMDRAPINAVLEMMKKAEAAKH